ncbi:MAG: alpha/beta hydrolase [Ilumatobacteraceae bacterium]|nr:alpha/beta hydrolase [Ilumatobacteraceae bacterium]
MTKRLQYDEFGMFHENASEYGISYANPPVVRRENTKVALGRWLSALVWGTESPQIVFLHGGAQNAHTWDTVALAMGVPLVCIDLPGHGHSDSAGAYDASAMPLAQNAADIAAVIRALAPQVRMVVGMSLGGLTTLALARDNFELVKKMVLVDVTPGVNQEKTKAITDFVNGPATFPSFEELLERTMQFNPTRTMSSMRRGILHNALQIADGSWVWRYRRDDAPPLPQIEGELKRPDTSTLWDVFDAYKNPLMFVRGMRPQSVVSDEDEVELLRRAPHTRVEHVQEAGHSVQGDTPLELSALLSSFLAS